MIELKRSELFEYTILFFFAYLILNRFLTETVSMLPKWFDLLDYPIILFLGLVVFLHAKSVVSNQSALIILIVVAVFIAQSAISISINWFYHYMPATLLMIGGYSAAPLAAVAVSTAKREINGSRLIRIIGGLSILQLAIILFFQIPFHGLTPDAITGSFGLNGYQLTTFLFLSYGVFIALNLQQREYSHRKKIVLAVTLTLVFTILFYLISFRFAIPAFFLTLVCFIFIMTQYFGFSKRKMIYSVNALSLVLIGVLLVFIRFAPQLQYDTYSYFLDTEHLKRTGKMASVSQATVMLRERPEILFSGVGAGTLISRGFTTFYLEPKYAHLSKGIGRFVSDYAYPEHKLHPLFTKYFLPIYNRDPVLVDYHKGQLWSPASSYLALILETGVVSFIAIAGLYLYAILIAYRSMKSYVNTSSTLFALAAGCFCGLLYLFLIGAIGDYWEVNRMTLPIWISFGILLNGRKFA